MIYFYSPYFKNYEEILNYAIVVIDEENEKYHIYLVRKDGMIYKQEKDKHHIEKMIKDEVLINEDPELFNINSAIAKFLLKEGVTYEH